MEFLWALCWASLRNLPSVAATMSPVEAVREFVSRRLSAAAGEIFSVFLPTLVQYQEKIQTQQRLLQTSRRETTTAQRTGERERRRLCWSNMEDLKVFTLLFCFRGFQGAAWKELEGSRILGTLLHLIQSSVALTSSFLSASISK